MKKILLFISIINLLFLISCNSKNREMPIQNSIMESSSSELESVPNVINKEDATELTENKNQSKVAHDIYLTPVDFYPESPDKEKFFSRNDSLDCLKNFNRQLRLNFDYLELNFQSFQLFDRYNGKDEFVYMTRKGDLLKNLDVNIDDEIRYATTLKTVQIGESLFFDNADCIAEGGITKEDFVLKEDNVLPAILGHQYRDIYSIGDTFTANFIFKDFTVRVDGFYKENTKITLDSQSYNLDSYICIPQFDIEYEPQDDEERLWQQRYYLHKNGGYLKVDNYKNFKNNDELYEHYSKIIKELAKENNVEYDIVYNTYSIKFETYE